MSRDLGKLGENSFSKICNEVGLKINKSHDEDSTGWDYILEFPDKEESLVRINHLEKDFSKPLCKIQVKSSDKKLKGHSIKLTNLKRFVNDPNPAFFIFFEFDGKNDSQRIFLIHVGKEIIGKTIKALRECDLSNEKNIHKKRIRITYSLDDLLEENTGKCLYKAIRRTIGNNILEYSSSKTRLVESVGYGSSCYKIKFNTIGSENLSDLVDTTLGLKNFAKVENVKVFENRFNLEKKINIISNGIVKIGPSKHPRKAHLVSLDDRGFELTRLEVDLYTPGGLYPRLPKNQKKIRVSTTFIEMIFKTGLAKANIKMNLPDPDEEFHILKLREQMDFIFDLVKSRNFNLQLNGKILIESNFVLNSSVSPEIMEAHKLINYVCNIIDYHKIKDCRTSLNQMKHQALQIYLYNASIGKITEMYLSSILSEKCNFQNLSKVAIVFSQYIHLGIWKIASSIAFTGNAELGFEEGKDLITFNSPLALKERSVKSQNTFSRKQIDELQKDLIASIDDLGYDYVLMK